MGTYEDQKRQQEQDQYYRMRPNLQTRHDGRPNSHYVKSPSSSTGGACFPAGTRIDTPTGPRDISAMRQGDVVVTVDMNTGARGTERVLKVRTRANHPLWRLTFTDGHRVTSTAIHSFHVDGVWRKARVIAAGDHISVFDGVGLTSRIVAESIAATDAADVYNLIVSGTFTFIADGAVVHCFTYFRGLRALGWRMVGFCRLAMHAMSQSAAQMKDRQRWAKT